MTEAPNKTLTKGSIVIQEIKVDDIHYEYETGLGICIKSKVVTLPKWDGKGYKWRSKRLLTGEAIFYYVAHGFSHYSPNLYDYEAYTGCRNI